MAGLPLEDLGYPARGPLAGRGAHGHRRSRSEHRGSVAAPDGAAIRTGVRANPLREGDAGDSPRRDREPGFGARISPPRARGEVDRPRADRDLLAQSPRDDARRPRLPLPRDRQRPDRLRFHPGSGAFHPGADRIGDPLRLGLTTARGGPDGGRTPRRQDRRPLRSSRGEPDGPARHPARADRGGRCEGRTDPPASAARGRPRDGDVHERHDRAPEGDPVQSPGHHLQALLPCGGPAGDRRGGCLPLLPAALPHLRALARDDRLHLLGVDVRGHGEPVGRGDARQHAPLPADGLHLDPEAVDPAPREDRGARGSRPRGSRRAQPREARRGGQRRDGGTPALGTLGRRDISTATSSSSSTARGSSS